MSKNLSELSGRKGIPENLFEKMGEAAGLSDGTPSERDLDALAEEFLVGKANTHGAVTFYDFLKPENKGKKAYVCNGTACVCAGTQDSVKEELEKHLEESEIGHMTCLGRCHENGAFHVNGANHSAKSPEEIEEIVKGNQSAGDDYRVEADKAVLTVPYQAQRATLTELRDALQGKIVVDVTVPLVPPKVMRVQLPEEGRAAQIAQAVLGDGVRVVSAFQNVSAGHLKDPDCVVDCDVLVTGDDPAARADVVTLAEAAGLTAIEAGPLDNAAAAEALTSLLIWINRKYKSAGAGIRITAVPGRKV